MLYVDWVSVDLNLTSRVSSGHSGFLPPQNWLLDRGPCVRKLFTGLIMYLPCQNKEHCIVLYCIVFVGKNMINTINSRLNDTSCFKYQGIKTFWVSQIKMFFSYCAFNKCTNWFGWAKKNTGSPSIFRLDADMSRTASNSTHEDFNKLHEVSPNAVLKFNIACDEECRPLKSLVSY